MAVEIDTQNRAIAVPDLGVTLRTMLAAAATGYRETNTRDWKVMYKGVKIGVLRVRTEKEPRNARPQK